MKLFRWCLPLFLVIAFLACKNEGASFTPYIQTSYFYLNPNYEDTKIVSAEDTLEVRLVGNSYVLDTVKVGDKVVFEVAYGSLGNELTTCRCNFDTTQFKMQATLSSILYYFLPSSDFSSLQLDVRPGINYLPFPMEYRPLRAGAHSFELRVESDSKFSPVSRTYIQPVR